MKKAVQRKNKKKVLVIVAHPDDETIWMGGTLLKNKDKWDTTIISLCRKYDKDRAPRFKKACKIYNSKCLMSNLEDETLKDIEVESIIKRIKKSAKGKSYDYLFTHGKNGEYGHKRHKDIHKAVIELQKNNALPCKRIFFFAYSKKGKIYCPSKNADKFIYLNNLSLKRKKYLIQNIYGFEKNSFEERCCRNIEAFNVGETI